MCGVFMLLGFMLHVFDVVSCIYVLCVSRVSFSNMRTVRTISMARQSDWLDSPKFWIF